MRLHSCFGLSPLTPSAPAGATPARDVLRAVVVGADYAFLSTGFVLCFSCSLLEQYIGAGREIRNLSSTMYGWDAARRSVH